MTSFTLSCLAGESGGLQQIFHLEIYDTTEQFLLYNLTSNEVPVFDVHNLTAATSFTLRLYAANAKGRSNNVTLNVVTLQFPEQDARKG